MSWGSLSTQEAEIEANSSLKGQCPMCGEIFNLRPSTDWGRRAGEGQDDLCGECADIFQEKN